MAETPKLKLATTWTPARDGQPAIYGLRLANEGGVALRGFRLGVNGPARLDAGAIVAGAIVVECLANHTVFAPPAGFTLEPGASWTIEVGNLLFPLRHWSDGANAAYVVFEDDNTARVATEATTATGDNVPLRRGTMPFPMPASVPAPVSVIPWPRHVDVEGSQAAPTGLDVHPIGTEAAAAGEAFAALVADLFPTEAIVRPTAEGGRRVTLSLEPGRAAEAYEIMFADGSAAISASTRVGLLYGLITLGQILRGAKQYPDRLSFPTSGSIADEPALGWRGTHLDVARRFYSSAEVERMVKLLAWNKMNRLHWHLSDDEGWRIEIDAYPELTSVGAWRGYGKALPPLLGSGPEPTGGYYSKAAVRSIVALGESLGVTIVPEIDMPGHCYAVLQALPALRDPGETGEYQSVQGFPNNCLNPAHEPVYRFVETVIDEMLELFPSRIFHLGADEVPLAAWSGSPLALAMLERLGDKALAERHRAQQDQSGGHTSADAIENSPTAVLQAQFIRRIHDHLRSKGAVTGGWEEAVHGGALDKDGSYLVGWRNVEINAALAAEGYDIVVSPGQRYYLDMANSAAWSEPGAAWAGWSGPEETYGFDPRAGMGPGQLKHLLGVQTCIWSEPMFDRAIFDRLVFPRLSAVAETGWTVPERKSWARFSAFAGLMPILYGNWAAE